MDSYSLFLSLHILSAVVWVGGAITVQILAVRTRAAADPQRMQEFAGDSEWIGMRVFMPAAILVLITGIILTLDAYSFGHFWIWFGLGGILFSIVVGAGFLGPESGRIKTLIAQHGPAHPEVATRIDRILLISRIELVVLVLVVLDMATKPGA